MSRSFGIDLMRTLSILLVILYHYGLVKGFNLGYFAIEFLFVISGFLIGQILFNDFYSTETVEASSVKRFMIRRWFRILPLYYFAILVKFIVDPSIGWNVFYYVFFLQNHFYGVTFYPETWTLVIDEWFYLGTPILLFLFMRYISGEKKAVGFYILGLIIFINILRIAWVYYSDRKWEGLVGNVPLRQDTLLLGVFLSFIKRNYYSIFEKMNSLKVFAFAVTLLVLYIAIIYSIRVPSDHINQFFWTRTLSFSLLSFLVFLSLPFIENSIYPFRPNKLKVVNKAIVWGSKLSYALYLFHGQALVLAKKVFLSVDVSVLLVRISGIILSFFLSYLLYQFLEKKFLIIRDKYYPDRIHHK